MNRANVLDRFLEPIGRWLTPEMAQRIADLRADAETETRLHELADKANEGTLTDAERHEYEAFVSALDLVSVLHIKARRVLAKHAGAA